LPDWKGFLCQNFTKNVIGNKFLDENLPEKQISSGYKNDKVALQAECL
jgi:hypothetical protein